MTVLSSEIKFFRPQTVSDTSANGGRISFREIVTGTEQNVFGHALSAERLAGSTKYRKVCVRVCNDNEESLMSALVRIFGTTPAGDAVSYHMGTARDTQDDITGSEVRYGAATITTAVVSGGSTLILACETSALATALYQVGHAIFITDKTAYNATTGNIEQRTVASRSVSGSTVTVTLAAPLANGYAAWNSETRTGGHVCSAPAAATIAPAISNVSKSLGSGDLDTAKIVVDSIGAAELTITLTYTDATNFTATTDDATHTLGSGVRSADFAPINPETSKPYLTIPAAAWSGTTAAGNSCGLQTHPPAMYLWERRDIPAACGSLSGNRVVLVAQGESA